MTCDDVIQVTNTWEIVNKLSQTPQIRRPKLLFLLSSTLWLRLTGHYYYFCLIPHTFYIVVVGQKSNSHLIGKFSEKIRLKNNIWKIITKSYIVELYQVTLSLFCGRAATKIFIIMFSLCLCSTAEPQSAFMRQSRVIKRGCGRTASKKRPHKYTLIQHILNFY